MGYLATHGYHSVTLGQVYESMAGRKALPTKPVALTFDDGGQDDFTVAFPILRSHHFVATFFVVTAEVGKAGHMNWAELKQMSMWGMAIESHTVHHHDLLSLPEASLNAELSGSREAIHAQLGLGAESLAYPDGGCDQQVMAATQAAGYLAAVTDKPGKSGDTLYPAAVYNWPRAGIGSREGLAQFERALAGLPPAPNVVPGGKAKLSTVRHSAPPGASPA
jgi:peptidoglycan/xylan/chitin deacetylase (PgdA/CDA1 family)